MMTHILSTPASLRAIGISKAFGGMVALHGVDLEVRQGEVVGLIGPNGSGKTTLLNVLSGVLAADSGRIELHGSELSSWPSHRRAAAGLARTFQNLRLFRRLTVRQNVEVALASTRDGADRLQADRLIEIAGLSDSADRKAGTLPYASQRRLELARALGLSPRYLLLDEPSAGMGDAETTAIATSIRQAVAQFSCGVICVDHDMQLIARISDRICVLQQGRVIADGVPSEIRVNPAVIEAYLGSAWADTEEET